MSLNEEERRIIVGLEYGQTSEDEVAPMIEPAKMLIAKIGQYIND